MVEQGTLVRSKGSSFLNSFWDLVSDCDATRERAAAYITNYLTNANKERNDQGGRSTLISDTFIHYPKYNYIYTRGIVLT